MPRPTKARAIQRLQRVRNAIPHLKQLRRMSPEFEKWHRDTRVAIENIFEGSPPKLSDFEGIGYHLMVVRFVNADYEKQEAYVRGLDSAAAVLQSMIDEVEEYWENDDQASKQSKASAGSGRGNTNQIFVIHGRDHGALNTVARFLEGLSLEPIILQEQPDEGRTVIEKFEQFAEGAFAVALFTSDDIGGSRDGGLRPRVRQNVIFEFGYFIGKFGRDRVRALVKGNPEIPSDYAGVLYIPMDDSGGWKQALIKELKAAGFRLDAN